MSQTTLLIETMKRVLKARGLTYADIAQRLDLSEASVKRLFSDQSFTLKKLENFCQALEIDFFELAKLARGAHAAPESLSTAQEQALTEDPRLMAVFYLLHNDWSLADIQMHYEISEADCIGLTLRLEKLALLDLLPNNRVHLRVSRSLRLLEDGPIRRRYGAPAVNDFLAVRFEEHDGHFRFEFRELSAASFEILKRKIDRLAAECHELAELDSSLPATQRQSIGIGLGIRPWKISLVTGLYERKAARLKK